jgi:hypothetical protein
MFESILSALGLSKGATVGGFLGAIVSLKLIENLNGWQRASTVFAGALAASFVTPLVLEVVSLSAKLESAVAFLIGVFGMSLGAALMKAIPEFVSAARNKFLGSSGNGSGGGNTP